MTVFLLNFVSPYKIWIISCTFKWIMLPCALSGRIPIFWKGGRHYEIRTQQIMHHPSRFLFAQHIKQHHICRPWNRKDCCADVGSRYFLFLYADNFVRVFLRPNFCFTAAISPLPGRRRSHCIKENTLFESFGDIRQDIAADFWRLFCCWFLNSYWALWLHWYCPWPLIPY